MIFRGLDRNDLPLLTTIVLCIRLGIRLPLFDEPNPYPFQIFKRAFGVPKEWQMPPGLFDVFPFAHKRILNALLKTTADQLEGARVVCRFLSHFLDNPKKWRRGAICLRWCSTTLVADQGCRSDVVVVSWARPDRWRYYLRNPGLQGCAGRTRLGYVCFDQERGEHLVAGVGVTDLCRDELLTRICGRAGGFITFDALRWLRDTGVAFSQLDWDRAIIIASGLRGLDRPALRGEQVLACSSVMPNTAVAIARELLRVKQRLMAGSVLPAST